MKKTIIRTCIACRDKIDISENKNYVRLSKSGSNIKIEKSTNKNDGRGAYICFSKDCLNKTIKQKLINKVFRKEVDDSIYQYIKNLV